ncbi:MAG: CHASE2 domain-containing protein [Methylophilaceae bacterium]|nr:CHASE2 domain-containing protein [Methylophilaceae bacterium]
MLSRLVYHYTRLTTLLARRLRNSFYLYLAALMTLGVLLDAAVFHVGENMRQKAFDFVVRHRIYTPQPDPDIVIVDVDEASIAALAPDYGRWPWPRQVFGEFVEKLQQQKPRAIVFDILFSDADLYNPDSDAYFNAVIAAADNLFFPFLRLPESQDTLSQIHPWMIPGVQRIADPRQAPAPPAPASGTTVAVVLPHFEAALKAGRLGTHNIYPDPDGIVREYRLWQDKDGWRLPSLPLVVGQAMGGKPPAQDSLLLNWRGGPFSYRYVSFADVYRDMTAKTPRRPADEFTGKIVIIGSTAPSLFDLKATAMARMHPGVEILATAIDNLKRGDPMRFWRGALPYLLLSLCVIWLTTAAFYHNVERDRFDRLFGMSQFLLLAVSYVGVSFANAYIDLSAPVTWAVLYFGIAKVYALATDRAMQGRLAMETAAGAESIQVLVMPVLFESGEPMGDAVLKRVRRAVQEAVELPCSVEALRGTQGGIWGLFGDMLVLTWQTHSQDTRAAAAMQADAQRLVDRLPGLLARQGVPVGIGFRHVLHKGKIDGDGDTAPQWRVLFAQAILKLEQRNAR